VIKDDLNSVFEGVYTTHGDIKRWNRDAEAVTVAAETAAALASRFGYAYPRAELVRTWRDILWNHHHDTITGTGIHEAYALSKQLYERGIASSRRIAAEAAAVIAARSPAAEGDLVVLNTLGWRRDAVVVARPRADLAAGALVAIGPDGTRRPVQKTAEGDLVFVARDLPAFGYRVYRLETAPPSGGKADSVACRNGGRSLSTARHDVDLDPRTGAIARFFDKAGRRNVLGGPGNDLKIHWEEPHGMSAWTIGNFTRVEPLGPAAGLEVVECGPVRARVRARRAWGKSAFVVDTLVYADLDHLEVSLDVDWREKGDAKAGSPFLKAHFPLAAKPATVRASIPFGDMDRPANGREFPALTWVVAAGVALLNDSKHGHSAADGVLALSLLRASYDPDPEPDVGRHAIRYALWPHAGGPHEAGVPRRGMGFNTAPIAVWARGGATAGAGGGALGAEASFLTLEGTGPLPLPTALKLSEDGAELVLRVFAASPANAEARFGGALKIARATAVNLVEDRLGDARPDAVSLRPYEIKTLRLGIEP
jgi:alpha-mannosidase